MIKYQCIKTLEVTMKQKLARETIVSRKEIFDQGIKYTYTMTINESTSTSSFGIPLYSIQIDMIDTSGSHTTSKICDIFSNIGKANAFFNKLVKNLATPLNLRYALEDEIF